MSDISEKLLREAAQKAVFDAAKLVSVLGAIMGIEDTGGVFQQVCLLDAVATGLIKKQSREDFLSLAAKAYDDMIRGRDEHNATSNDPLCPGCGMRHPPHDYGEHGPVGGATTH